MNEELDAQNVEYEIRQLQQMVEGIENQIIDVQNTRNSIIEFGDLKGEKNALFPLGNGIFVNGKLGSEKKLLINIGSNVVAEKSVDETIQLMDKQLIELETYKNEIIAAIQKMLDKYGG